MYTLRLYNDPFSSSPTTLQKEHGKTIKEDIDSVLGTTVNTYKSQVYDINNGETQYIFEAIEDYDVAIVINDGDSSDAEGTLDTVTKKDSTVIAILIPHGGSKKQWGTFWSISGAIGSTIGTVLSFIPTPITQGIGTACLALGAAQSALGGYLLRETPSSSRGIHITDDAAIEQEKNMSLSGGQNKEMLNQRYPIVMGKHLMNPGIIGSPYNETYTNEKGEDAGQYLVELLCLGYGPLRVTNFRIGDTWLSYNQTTGAGANVTTRPTVMHGKLHASEDEFKALEQQATIDSLDILKKWKANDVTLEILQAGTLSKDKNPWGTIYPQAVEQISVNANLLNIKDSLIAEVASMKAYMGATVPDGFKTNTVRFSRSCPKRIEVEIEFPNGLFSNFTMSGNQGSFIRYNPLPVRLAIQYRFVKEGQASSDADSPDGWNDFKYIEVKSPTDSTIPTKISPSTYTIYKKYFDYKMHRYRVNGGYFEKISNIVDDGTGKDVIVHTFGDKEFELFCDDKWLGHPLFEFGCEAQIDKPLEEGYYKTVKRYRFYIRNGQRLNQKEVDDNSDDIDTDTDWEDEDTMSQSSDYDGVDGSYLESSTDPDSDGDDGEGGGGADDYPEGSYVNENGEIVDYRGTWGQRSGRYKKIKITNGVWKIESVEHVKIDSEEYDKLEAVLYKDGKLVHSVDEPPTVIKLESILEDDDEHDIIDYKTDYRVLKDGTRVIKDGYVENDYYYGTDEYGNGIMCENKTLRMRDVFPDSNSSDGAMFDVYPPVDIITDVTHLDYNGELKVELESMDIDSYSCGLPIATVAQIAHSKDYFKEHNTVNARRFVAVTEMSNNECKVLADKTSGYLDCVEVRVLRITPSYLTDVSNGGCIVSTSGFIDKLHEYVATESVNSDVLGKFGQTLSQVTFSDLCKWASLRTFAFDKEAFNKALSNYRKFKARKDYAEVCKRYTNEITACNGDSKRIAQVESKPEYKYMQEPQASDYPLRPQSKEDMDKFCYVALKIKPDASGETTGTLQKVSCVVEAFAPNYVDNHWIPNELHKTYEYFRKDKNTLALYPTKDSEYANEYGVVVSGENKYAKEDYDASIASGNRDIIYVPSGSDFEEQMRQDLFSESNYNGDKGRYELNENGTAIKCLTANTAAVALKILVGKHLGKDAKTYEELNLPSFTDAYNFCKVVTDGTPAVKNAKGEYGDEYVDEYGNTTKELVIHYECNGIVTNDVKLDALLQKILITGRCALCRDDLNRYKIVAGRAVPYPVMVINQQNCISASNTRSFEDKPSGLLVNFVDRTDNWIQNSLFVMSDGEDYRHPSKEVESLNFDYVTDRNQIWSLGRYNLGARIVQREQYSRTIGKSGLALGYGDLVLLQDSTLLIGTDNGGRISELIQDSSNIYGFVCDDLYEYTITDEEKNRIRQEIKKAKEAGRNWVNSGATKGVTIVQPQKYGPSRCVTLRMAALFCDTVGDREVWQYTVAINKLMQRDVINPKTKKKTGMDTYYEEVNYTIKEGLTNIVLFQYPIRKKEEMTDDTQVSIYTCVRPTVGNLVAFGEVGNIAIRAQVMSIKPTENYRYELTLAKYDDSLFHMGKELPVFNSNMTRPQHEYEDVDFSNEPTRDEIDERIANKLNSTIDSVIDAIEKNEPIHISRKPGKPSVIECKAERDYITLTWKPATESVIDANRIAEWKFTRKYDNAKSSQNEKNKEDSIWLKTTLSSIEIRTGKYIFNRETDGFPEREDLSKWRFIVRLVPQTTVSNVEVLGASDWSDSCAVNTDFYGTWTPTAPVIKPKEDGRSISLGLSQQPSNIEIYGNIEYSVLIRRESPNRDAVFKLEDNNSGKLEKDSNGKYINAADGQNGKKMFYCPDTGSGFSVDEDNYKEGGDKDYGEHYKNWSDKELMSIYGASTMTPELEQYRKKYATAYSRYNQTLPLVGQNRIGFEKKTTWVDQSTNEEVGYTEQIIHGKEDVLKGWHDPITGENHVPIIPVAVQNYQNGNYTDATTKLSSSGDYYVDTTKDESGNFITKQYPCSYSDDHEKAKGFDIEYCKKMVKENGTSGYSIIYEPLAIQATEYVTKQKKDENGKLLFDDWDNPILERVQVLKYLVDKDGNNVLDANGKPMIAKQEKRDANGKVMTSKGNILYQEKLDKDGNVVLDANGNIVYENKKFDKTIDSVLGEQDNVAGSFAQVTNPDGK